MSYDEYFDMFENAQKNDCPYKAFLIDVKNSRVEMDGENGKEYLKFHKCVNYITNAFLKINKVTGEKIFLVDENNVTCFVPRTETPTKGVFDNNLVNPMVLGDAACFFAKNKKITDTMFIEILCKAIKKFDIDFSFYFMSGKYETDDYVEGGKKLYKGYMLQLLEKTSKKNGIIIDKNFLKNKENDEKKL